jgi:hypothetical protein
MENATTLAIMDSETVPLINAMNNPRYPYIYTNDNAALGRDANEILENILIVVIIDWCN